MLTLDIFSHALEYWYSKIKVVGLPLVTALSSRPNFNKHAE